MVPKPCIMMATTSSRWAISYAGWVPRQRSWKSRSSRALLHQKSSTMKMVRSAESRPVTWALAKMGSQPITLCQLRVAGQIYPVCRRLPWPFGQASDPEIQPDKDADPQHYGIGIKELWEIDPAKHKPGLVMHGAGWPLSETGSSGGWWLYHAENNR